MEEKFTYSKTFRFEHSNPKENLNTLIYVLHGYGQQAKYFIRKFQPFFQDYIVVAPEGMHRFYLEGSNGRVGASWMTKEAREDDISDTVEWLNALDTEMDERFQPSRKIVLGFSQGGAAAARWFHLGNTSFDALILCSCVFPPDLEADIELQSNPNQHFAIGDADEFYNGDNQDKLIELYRKKNFSIRQFSGKHDIHADTLKEILSEINAVDLKR